MNTPSSNSDSTTNHSCSVSSSDGMPLIRKEQISAPVIEEKIHISKEIVETGKLVVRKKTHIDNEELNIPLRKSKANIKRIPIDKFVEEAPPSVRKEGNQIIVSITKEVIIKKILLVEELHISSEEFIENYKENISLRRDEVEITRQSAGEQ